MMKKIIYTWILGVVCLVMQATQALAEVRIVIDEGVDSARPIAVVPFKWNAPGTPPADVADIISSDLRFSGKFNPIPVDRMPQHPTSAGEVNVQAWSALGIDAIVVGQVTPANGGFNISYQLVDTVGASGTPGAVLAQSSYTVTKQWIRWGAHTVSDQVFEKLTGIRGAFRTRIAYVIQNNSGSYDLQVSDYDGYNAFNVFHSSQPIMSPAWSADGKKLAYSVFEKKKSLLVLQDLASKSRKIIASLPGHNGAPSFSPDGSRIAFASSEDGVLNIYVMGVGGGSPVKLTSGSGNNTEPSWSTDGSSIIFTSDRGGAPAVYMMGANGGGATLLSPPGNSYSGEMSPDGKEVVMVNGNKLVKKDLESGSITALTSTFLDESPSFAPNGTMVIYSSTQGVSKVLQLVSSDGRFKARLPGSGGGQIKFPAWSPYLTQN